MTINETSFLFASFSFLVGAGIAYFIAKLSFLRRLALESERGTRAVDAMRATYDGKMEQVRADAVAQIERIRVQERATFQAEMETARTEHGNRMKETVQRFEKQLKQKTDSDLSVTLYPIVNHERKSGVFSDETKVEIGHSYQLFVRGIPCFKSHEVIVERTTEKKLDEKRLEQFREKAFLLAESLLNANSSGIATKVISVAKTVVKQLK